MSRSPFDPRYEHLPTSLPIFPLPGALPLLGAGLAAFGALKRRKKAT